MERKTGTEEVYLAGDRINIPVHNVRPISNRNHSTFTIQIQGRLRDYLRLLMGHPSCDCLPGGAGQEVGRGAGEAGPGLLRVL